MTNKIRQHKHNPTKNSTRSSEYVSATILLDSLSKLPLTQSPRKKLPLVHSPAAHPLYTTPSTVTSLYPLSPALHHSNVSLASRQLVREAGAVVRFGVGV
jgi:hypothetical protein